MISIHATGLLDMEYMCSHSYEFGRQDIYWLSISSHPLMFRSQLYIGVRGKRTKWKDEESLFFNIALCSATPQKVEELRVERLWYHSLMKK